MRFKVDNEKVSDRKERESGQCWALILEGLDYHTGGTTETIGTGELLRVLG